MVHVEVHLPFHFDHVALVAVSHMYNGDRHRFDHIELVNLDIDALLTLLTT